jgi:DNA-3-methyladenine glycosylase
LSLARDYPPAPHAYFERDARHLARALIGAFLVHERRVARIVETEAYRGPSDGACHARVGLTKRTRTLLGPPGRAYVFLVYGMHECFNVVCLRDGSGHAVLVRAAEPLLGLPPGVRCDGPGKLARAMAVTRDDDGRDLTGPPLYISPAQERVRVSVSGRVGVAYAGAIADKPWRFFDAASKHVSRPPAKAIGLGRYGTPQTT